MPGPIDHVLGPARFTKELMEGLEPYRKAVDFQELLANLGLALQIHGDRVHHGFWAGVGAQKRCQIERGPLPLMRPAVELDQLRRHRRRAVPAGPGRVLLDAPDAGDAIRLVAFGAIEKDLLLSVKHDVVASVGELVVLHDAAQAGDGMRLGIPIVVLLPALLEERDHHGLATAQGIGDHGPVARFEDMERQERPRKEDDIWERKDRL